MVDRTTTVLIADNDRENAEATAQTLKDFGFQTRIATRFREALDLFLKEPSDVVLLGMLFPDGTGFDLIKSIRSFEWTQEKSVILLHAVISSEIEIIDEDAKAVGADGVLPKPLNLDELSVFLPERLESAEESVPEDFDFGPLELEELPNGDVTVSESHPAVAEATTEDEPEVEEPPDETRRPPDEPLLVHTAPLSGDSLLSFLAVAAADNWEGVLRLDVGERRWSEIGFEDGMIRFVETSSIGPGFVNVAFRQGFIPAKQVSRWRLDVREHGETKARKILSTAGLDEAAIDQVLELTVFERVMTAFEVHEGQLTAYYRRFRNRRTFEVQVRTRQLLCNAVDRHFPIMWCIERYGGNEGQPIVKTSRFDDFLELDQTEAFSTKALENLVDGESALDWVQRNRENPGRCFVLLTKLELCDAVRVGDLAVGLDLRSEYVELEEAEPETEPAPSEGTALPAPDQSADVPAANGAQLAPPATTSTDLDPSAVAPTEPTERLELSPALADAISASHEVVGAEFPRISKKLKAPVPRRAVAPEPPRDLLWTELWFHVVVRQLRRGSLERARTAASTRARDKPSDPDADAFKEWIRFARAVSEGVGDPGHPLTQLELALEADPSNPFPFFLVGIAAVCLGNVDQAVAHLDRALKLSPANPFNNAAAALARAGFWSHPTADLSFDGVWRSLLRIVESAPPKGYPTA